MTWPTMSDYQDVIQNPRTCFSDLELKSGAPVLNPMGLPMPITGGFASVYQIVNGRRWAVRCFLHEYSDQQKRYEVIGRHIRAGDFSYKVGFDYQPGGIRLHGKSYPILKMEWVEGLPLNAHIESILGDRPALAKLAGDWRMLIKSLQASKIAHGDLQHGNVLVAGNKLVLIDYDGMYVPALAGMGTHEAGHPNYQHPKRSMADVFGPEMDRFSGLAIYVAILALSRRPELWPQFNNGDNILFRKEDFVNPPRSRLFAALRQIQDSEVVGRVMALQAASVGPIKFVPDVDDAHAAPNLPAWVMDNLCAPPDAFHSETTSRSNNFDFSFSQAWMRPGPRYVKHVHHEPVYQTRTRDVTKDVPVDRKAAGWAIYISACVAALAAHPILFMITLILGPIVFRLVKGTKQIEVPETYKVQTGTREAEEWIRIHEDGHDRAVTSIAFSRDGRTLWTGGEDKRGFGWNVESGERSFEMSPHAQKMTGIVPVNGTYIATASWDKTFRLCTQSGEIKKEFELRSNTRFYAIASDPAGRYIALGLGRKKILIWDVAAESEIAGLEGHRRKVLSVAFFPDGKRLVSGSADMSVRVWDLTRGTSVVLYGHTNDVNTVCVSPDGNKIASGGDDGVIFVWDAKTYKPSLKILTGARVCALSFSPDGERLLSGGADGLVHCWDSVAGHAVGSLAGHDGAVRGVTVTADGRKIASCGEDGHVILWTRAKQMQGVN